MNALSLSVCWFFLGVVTVQAQAPFYQGKSVRIITGYAAEINAA